MPLLVRVRPNAVYLLVMLVAAVLTIQAFRGGDVLGTILGCAMGVVLIVIASPIVRSTLLGTRALAITPDGLSCPLMGLYLRWDEIAVIRRSVGPLQRPLLLIIPTAPDAVIRQVRPWLRRDVRRNLARYGAPLALADTIMDHSLDDSRRASAVSRATRRIGAWLSSGVPLRDCSAALSCRVESVDADYGW